MRSGCSPLPLNLIQPIRIWSHSAMKSVSGSISSSVRSKKPFACLAVELDRPPDQRRRRCDLDPVRLAAGVRAAGNGRQLLAGGGDGAPVALRRVRQLSPAAV